MFSYSAEQKFSQLKGPAQLYQDCLQAHELLPDQAQEKVVVALDDLWHQLLDFKVRRDQFLGRSLLSPSVPNGLYIWGGVGRGKTILMDLFYDSLPYKRKMRVHFHQFMSDFHLEMQRHQASDDPLVSVAELWVARLRVLCLDEFFVENIADAMILSRLLDALFARGLVLVLTSNCAPDRLYEHGLQRQSFLPAISLLKKYLDVKNLDGESDYRKQKKLAGSFFVDAADVNSEREMYRLFVDMSAGARVDENVELMLAGHPLCAWRCAGTVVWFKFSELCESAHSQEDYLQLAKKFKVVFVSCIPVFAPELAAAAKRFTWLIDVLYDHKIKLVASMLGSPEQLMKLCGNADSARTVSRLIEMQGLVSTE